MIKRSRVSKYTTLELNQMKVIDNLQKEKEHYKHLYSKVKKQKDDVVEFIKEHLTDNGRFLMLNEWQVPDLLRMLGDKDV